MELHITLSEDSLKSLKAAVATEVQQPGLVAENTVQSCPDLYREVAGRIDYSRLAEEYSCEDIAEHIDLSDLSSEIDLSHISAEDLAQHIDISEVAREVDIDLRDVADHINLSDLASEFDTYDMADRVAEKLDYDEIVGHVSANEIAQHIVAKFVNNAEFRKVFVEELVERLAKSVPAT